MDLKMLKTIAIETGAQNALLPLIIINMNFTNCLIENQYMQIVQCVLFLGQVIVLSTFTILGRLIPNTEKRLSIDTEVTDLALESSDSA